MMYENETVLGTTPVGESCSPSSDTEQEKCARPTIKECVDRNKYCTGPPVVSRIILPKEISIRNFIFVFILQLEIDAATHFHNYFLVGSLYGEKKDHSRTNQLGIWMDQHPRYSD